MWYLHSFVNVLNAIELSTLKWLCLLRLLSQTLQTEWLKHQKWQKHLIALDAEA